MQIHLFGTAQLYIQWHLYGVLLYVCSPADVTEHLVLVGGTCTQIYEMYIVRTESVGSIRPYSFLRLALALH